MSKGTKKTVPFEIFELRMTLPYFKRHSGSNILKIALKRAGFSEELNKLVCDMVRDHGMRTLNYLPWSTAEKVLNAVHTYVDIVPLTGEDDNEE